MKLLTKEIMKKLPKLYATEQTPLAEKEVICKFFNPCGIGTCNGLTDIVQNLELVVPLL